MLKKIKLENLFIYILLLFAMVGIGVTGSAFAYITQSRAESAVTSKALVLLTALESVQNYTNDQVRPEFGDNFVPEIIPFYASREVFEGLRINEEYNSYTYKDAMLNPTNLKDKADAFEEKIINIFRSQKAIKQLKGYYNKNGIDSYYIARPIVISKPSCLQCHATPEDAPARMVAQYGSEHGFGWKLNEIVGTQIVSVPVSNVFNNAYQAVFQMMGIIVLALALPILAVKILVNLYVIVPLTELTKVAEEISEGNKEIEFELKSKNELGILAKALNRMKRSFEIYLP